MAGRMRRLAIPRRRDGRSDLSRARDRQYYAMTLARRERDMDAEIVPLVSPSGKRNAIDARSGTTLGKLLLRFQCDRRDPGGISPEQYEAGEAWADIVRRHDLIHGIRRDRPSPSFVLVSGGVSTSAGFGEAEIAEIKRRFVSTYDELMAACRIERSMVVRDITYGACVEQWPLWRLDGKVGFLRVGLNAIKRGLR